MRRIHPYSPQQRVGEAGLCHLRRRWPHGRSMTGLSGGAAAGTLHMVPPPPFVLSGHAASLTPY